MYDKPPPDYDAIEREEWRKNALLVCEELDTKSERLTKRILLFISRFGFTKADVENKINVDLFIIVDGPYYRGPNSA